MEVKPGYKQTEVGVIPEDWEVGTLSEITQKIGSGITPTGGEQTYKTEGRPFIRSQNGGWGKLLLDDVAFIDGTTHATFPETEVALEDVLLNITGASIGRSAVADSRVAHGNVNQHVCIIRAIPSRLEPHYLNHFLLSWEGQRRISSFQTGGNRQGLNFGQIRSICLPLPSPPEQRAIAQALSDVDALLDGLDRLIAKKRDLKQAAMQQLLTGQTRLPGFHGEWKKTQMEDMGSTYSGLTGKTKSDFGVGSAHYVSFMNVMSNVVIDCGTFERVNVSPTESQNRVQRGDLLFNGSSETPEEVAMCAVLLNNVQDVYLNSFCFGFRFREGAQTDALFLAYYIRSKEGRELMKSLAQGSTRYNLSKAALLSEPLRLPSLAEQTAIAYLLSDMDAELESLEQRREKTRALKQAMMQELLTGKTRLV